MKFGPVPLSEAEGGILAHSVALPRARLRKGRAIDGEDIRALEAAGVAQLTVARLDPGDVAEDRAAEDLARALVPDAAAVGLHLGKAATGRVNIYATGPGVLALDAARIHAVNAVHPMITVATLPSYKRLADRAMVATVKIISYAVPGDALQAACAEGQAAMARAAPVIRSAALIETSVGDDPGDKGRRATRARLDRLGVALKGRQVVPHDSAALATAIGSCDADMVLILTGSATSDLYDTAPQALRAAGGSVTHFGMPVDPGNLLFFGKLGDKPVIGLPGCARSPALNGADWVLERMICGIEVTPRDIASMGVGGLLKEPPSRPRPREG